MSFENEEPIVIKRTKSKIYKDNSKRVSFDENALSETKFKESRTLELGSLKKVLQETYENEKCDSHKEITFRRGSRKFYPSLLERGVPEGQEDPKRYSSTSSLSECGKDFCPKNTVDCSYSNAKALLVKKFLKSIPSKRVIPKCMLTVTKNRVVSLHVSNLRRSDLEDYSVVIKLLSEEITRNSPKRENITSNLKSSIVKLLLSHDKNCTLYKAYKVLSVEGCPVLAVITSNSLCFVGYCEINDSFTIHYSCTFANLLAAVVGPFSQLVIVFNESKERFFINTGLSESAASDLISHLEVAIRRWCIKAKKDFNFNVAQVHDIKSMGAFHSLLPGNALVENEVVIAQYSVWLQEDYVEAPSPLGPEKEGYLMTRIGTQSSWAPSYVCLKGGVLYLFEKSSQCRPIPEISVPLRSPCYKGCRIHNNSQRPHTFEILMDAGSTYIFGAADESEMMEWIRYLYSSSQASNVEVSSYLEKESPLVNCFVTLSSNQILLHRFPNEIISRAFLDNVTSFTKSSWPNSYYCLLELCCREASEMGGDWILYFVSDDCFKNFCSKFAEIANHSVTAYQVEDERFLTHKSDRISAKIRSSWDSFFV